MTKAEKQKARREKRRLAGLCIDCDKPANASNLCDEHREKRNANARARLARNAHPCARCSSPVVSQSRKLCQSCAATMALRRRWIVDPDIAGLEIDAEMP